MAADPALFREFAQRLWRLATDQAKDVPYETRRELGDLSAEFDEMADQIGETTERGHRH